MAGLRAQFVESVPSSEGRQADILFIEQNGETHPCRCLCRGLETEISGDPTVMDYLNERYTTQVVCMEARIATLSGTTGE